MFVAAAVLLFCAPINGGKLLLQLQDDENDVATHLSQQAKYLWVLSPPLPTVCREISTLMTAK